MSWPLKITTYLAEFCQVNPQQKHDENIKAVGEENMEQTGIFSYFLIPLTDNPKLKRAILMTKGMNENDKWCGEMDGIIYILE